MFIGGDFPIHMVSIEFPIQGTECFPLYPSLYSSCKFCFLHLSNNPICFFLPPFQIDFVYVRLTDDFKLLEASLVDDGVRGDKAASDHIGVAAVIAPISPSSGKR